MKFKILSLLLLGLTACDSITTLKIDADAFEKKLAEAGDKAQIIDVRSPGEYETGHLKDARNISISSDGFDQEIMRLDQGKPVFVYCLSSGRSSAAHKKFLESGFKTVYELKGGIKAWKRFDKPMVGVTEVPEKTIEKPISFEEALKGKNPVLVDFSAEWCRPCKMMEPFIHQLKEEKAEQLTVVTVDTDERKDLAARYQVASLPTIAVFESGEMVARDIGYRTKEQLEAFVEPFLD